MGRQRIFIVEDDRVTRELLLEALRDSYEVFFARSGRQALRSVKVAAPDLLILDLGLPEMSGDAFVRAWRERDAAARAVPIIVISALAGGASVSAEIGAAAYHPKPFRLTDLKADIRRLLPVASPSVETTTVRIGEMRTTSGHDVRISVQADAPTPFILEVIPGDVTMRLTAAEFELALTLLDLAARKAGMTMADTALPDPSWAELLETAFPRR